jgi:hypothetical protein
MHHTSKSSKLHQNSKNIQTKCCECPNLKIKNYE